MKTSNASLEAQRAARKAERREAMLRSGARTKKVYIDYQAGDTFGGLFGNWSVEGRDENGEITFGLMSGYGQCVQDVYDHGLTNEVIEYTERAKTKLKK